MREITASAPAKVNLTLRVGEPAPDGYHPLITVFEALDLRETVTVRTSRSPGIRVETTAFLPDGSVDAATTRMMRELPADSHLAVRAAKTLQRLAMTGPWAHTAAGLDIRVDKRIPVAGGMAGGSADAAAALLACNELWELGLDGPRLELLGRSIGADVPACLMGGIALGTGRGDHMEPLDTGTAPRHHWAIALAHEGLATPGVFRALDEAGGPGGSWRALEEPSDAEKSALLAGAAELAPLLVNDLQDTALRMRPELADTMRAAEDAGALAVILSGSGPSIAALAEDEERARGVAEALAGAPGVARAFTARGPVPGAGLE